MENQKTPVKDRRKKVFSHFPFYFAKLLLLVCSATCFQWCLWTKGDGAPAHSIPAHRAQLPQEIKQWCLNWCSNLKQETLASPLPLGMNMVGWSTHLLCKTLHTLSLSAAAPGKTDIWWQKQTNKAWNPELVPLVQTQLVINCYDLPHPDYSCCCAMETNTPLENHWTITQAK